VQEQRVIAHLRYEPFGSLSPLYNSTVMYLIQLSVQVAITSSPPNFLDQHIVALSLHYSSSETQASSCGA
jgi:hypothetical protein